MEKSESIINLSKALLKFDAEVGKVSKGEINPFFKNKYASLPDILDAIKEPLQNAGLIIKQFPEMENALTTLIIHAETGEFISTTYQMKAIKDDPQQQGSRITYQRRYAIGAALGLNIDIDDDGNKASVPSKQQSATTLKQTTTENKTEKQWLSDDNCEIIRKRIMAGEKDLLEKTKAIYKISKKNYEILNLATKN